MKFSSGYTLPSNNQGAVVKWVTSPKGEQEGLPKQMLFIAAARVGHIREEEECGQSHQDRHSWVWQRWTIQNRGALAAESDDKPYNTSFAASSTAQQVSAWQTWLGNAEKRGSAEETGQQQYVEEVGLVGHCLSSLIVWWRRAVSIENCRSLRVTIDLHISLWAKATETHVDAFGAGKGWHNCWMPCYC